MVSSIEHTTENGYKWSMMPVEKHVLGGYFRDFSS